MKILVSFSGGKDSQACLIKACEDFGAKNVTAIFCDTKWEHHITYRHIDYVVQNLGVELVYIENKSIDGFIGLIKRMKWFPDSNHRMCTVQLKIQPMIDYILSIDDDVLIIQGIRAAESKQRSLLPCSADYFAEYDNPKGRLYRKKDVAKWRTCHKAIVERPMLGASAQDVIDYILKHGQDVNPLYKKGFSRVGCYPCIYSRMSDIKAMRFDKYYVDRVCRLEMEVNEIRAKDAEKYSPATLLQKGKIPERFCTTYGNGAPYFGDAVRYVSRDDAQLDLFCENDATSCMSIYHGLCE